jgi:hypothetical protein
MDQIGRPGANAYEILAFFAQSSSMPVGYKAVDFFDENINFRDQLYGGQLLLGNGARVNHSFQWSHSSAITWKFWENVMAQTGAMSTYAQPQQIMALAMPALEAAEEAAGALVVSSSGIGVSEVDRYRPIATHELVPIKSTSSIDTARVQEQRRVLMSQRSNIPQSATLPGRRQGDWVKKLSFAEDHLELLDNEKLEGQSHEEIVDQVFALSITDDSWS